jgi:hypothetical protein
MQLPACALQAEAIDVQSSVGRKEFCPNQLPCSSLVKRSWEMVSNASAKATQLAAVWEYSHAVR